MRTEPDCNVDLQGQHPTDKAPTAPHLDSRNDRLLTAAELAGVLRMHEVSIRRLALRGEIPHLKIGRSVRFRLADVLASIEQKGG